MRLPPRPARRLLVPVTIAVIVAAMAVFAAVGLVGLLAAAVDRRRRLLRVAGFALAYGGMELATLVAAAGLWLCRPPGRRERSSRDRAWSRRNQALLTWALGLVLGAAERCFGFVVVVDEVPGSVLDGPEPVLILARHGGPGDSFALVHLFLATYRRDVRIVLKEILQLDPVLDVLLNRLDSCFLPAAGDALAERLGGMARALGERDALLVFPEGGNWTPTRRHRAILRLRREHRAEDARAATLMTHVLPPRPGGVLACLDARPDLAVVMVAHAGLDQMVTMRQAWDELPLQRSMTVRLWPAAPAPTDPDDRRAWLTTEWATVDEWVDASRHRP